MADFEVRMRGMLTTAKRCNTKRGLVGRGWDMRSLRIVAAFWQTFLHVYPYPLGLRLGTIGR